MSIMKMGETTSKKLIIKGSDAFQIVSVNASDDRVEAKFSDAKKKLHIVPISIKSGDQVGPFKATLGIVTDMGGVTKTIAISGDVVK